MSITIVWQRMLGSDDEASARKMSKMFDDPRVRQFYDNNRLTGTEYAKTIFKTFGKDALSSLPKDHSFRGMMEKVAKAPSEKVPTWDVVFFYKADSKWKETVPKPAGWSKQIAFLGESDDEPSGLFWVDSFKSDLKKSDWYDEVRSQLKRISKK